MAKRCRKEERLNTRAQAVQTGGAEGPGGAHPVTRGAAAWPQTSRPC